MDEFKELVLGQLKSLKPSFLGKKPHFNFISVHYFWIIGLSILGSVLIYASGRGQLAYIDALTFASGANTQAGLNTVDVNLLNTFQQLVIFFLSMMANPIAVNSFVVFLRLYWFEKRFQHVVREANQRRNTLSKTKSRARNDQDRVERGVNGRNITVMRNGTKSRITNDGILLDAVSGKAPYQSNGTIPEDDIDPRSMPVERQESRRPEIKFADTVKRSDGVPDDTIKLPPRLSEAEHINILERQRNPSSDEILRIPGPRDAERGMLPSRVYEGDEEEPDGNAPQSPRGRGFSIDTARDEPSVNPATRAITIEEPRKPDRMDEFADDARAIANVFSPLRLRKPRIFNRNDQKLHHEGDAVHVARSTGPSRRKTFETIRTAFSRDKDKDELTPYLSWEPTLGRNSAFPGLTEEQREELGGIEYRSLKTLALILVCYFWGFTLFGYVCLVPWITKSDHYGSIVDSAGQSRTWWGFFTPQSAFMDLGFTLTPDSMNSFNDAVFPLLLMAFLIVIGNTGFPVMLRFIIWLTSLVVPRGTGLYEELKFLLDHPRRCFTLLFPSGATWWLFWLLVILNGLDLIFFIVLDLGFGPVNDMPVGIRLLDGLFQAFSTRTAGFSCVNLANVHPAVQTSYMIMMYISVFPIAISVRRTNVYEEKSLGMYTKNDAVDEPANGTELEYVGAHLRRQLSFDLWFLFIGFFILTISEGWRLMHDDNFSMFAVLFEIVSAYGTVGLSLGYSGVNASLCSQFSVVGKLVICGMMIRGRHRGLPYGLDRAILLPSESLNAKEAADADARMARRASNVSLQTYPSRGASATRGRGRSRSVDRGNSIFSQFLHPGPAIPHEPSVLLPPKRFNTEPVSEEHANGFRRGGSHRAETFGTGSQSSTKARAHL